MTHGSLTAQSRSRGFTTMTELTDIASENQRQWKSINSLAAEERAMTKEVIVAALTAVGVFGAALFFAVCSVISFVRGMDDEDEDNEEDC